MKDLPALPDELDPTNPHTTAGAFAVAALAIACLLAGAFLT